MLYCLFLVVWAKVADKVRVKKPKPPTGQPVTIVDDEYRAHFIKQGKENYFKPIDLLVKTVVRSACL